MNRLEEITMRCEELYHLLTIYKGLEDRAIAYQLIATHIRSCPSCSRGLPGLTSLLTSLDALSCAECRALFPDYYEATHPDHPQILLPDLTIASIALHLGRCLDCHRQYQALADLSQLEELGL
jgi:hypothetical protein